MLAGLQHTHKQHRTNMNSVHKHCVCVCVSELQRTCSIRTQLDRTTVYGFRVNYTTECTRCSAATSTGSARRCRRQHRNIAVHSCVVQTAASSQHNCSAHHTRLISAAVCLCVNYSGARITRELQSGASSANQIRKRLPSVYVCVCVYVWRVFYPHSSACLHCELHATTATVAQVTRDIEHIA